jgi:aminoglycoside 3-N-acetyltransferase
VNTISAEDISQSLLAVGVRNGDIVLVHSDAMVAAQLPPMPDDQRLELVVGAIESVIGPGGTLLMPAFSYSFARNEPFDVLKSPARVGMLAEWFRKRPGVKRTLDPIFSFSVKGPQASFLCSRRAAECFGSNSVFAALHELNCKIVSLGCSLTQGGTFVHYVEKSYGVDYRYDKIFHGITITDDGIQHSLSVVYYVRDLERKSNADLRRLHTKLAEQELLKTSAAGRVRLLAVQAADFFATATQMLSQAPHSLIAEGAIAA